MTESVTASVASYIAAARDRALPSEVLEKTKQHVIDSVAAIVSGARLKPGMFGARFAMSLGGTAEATILGTPHRTSALNAALANGMAGHADETDDSHLKSRSHLGCAVVPAALAMAERQGTGGMQFLRAVALGYDIGARSTMALGYGPAKTQKHSTHSIAATFGATAAAASLAAFDTEQAIYALSYATQQASGVPSWNRDPEHIEKAFDFGGMGARNGVFAALIVEAGATGVRDSLTSAHSFIDAFAEKADPAALAGELGQRYEIMHASIKKWCVGSPIQAALDSVMHLIETHGIRADDVVAVTAHMPDDRLHVVSNREIPDICLEHLLALALVDRGITFASSHDEARMYDPAVLAVRERIAAKPSAELTEAKPARQAIIDITVKDGRTVSQRTRAVLGTPDNPMSAADIEAKALDLVEPVLGAARGKQLIETLRTAERIDDIRALRPLLAG
jgi:2-methylcitrate dehydratase PrpD